MFFLLRIRHRFVQRPGRRRPILQPDGFPSLNNAGDLCLLLDEQGVDDGQPAIRCHMGWRPGISIERIDPPVSSTVRRQLGDVCQSPAGATPGNGEQYHDPSARSPYETVRSGPISRCCRRETCPCVVQNAGSERSGPFELRLRKTDAGTEVSESIASLSVNAELLPGDSIACMCTLE